MSAVFLVHPLAAISPQRNRLTDDEHDNALLLDSGYSSWQQGHAHQQVDWSWHDMDVFDADEHASQRSEWLVALRQYPTSVPIALGRDRSIQPDLSQQHGAVRTNVAGTGDAQRRRRADPREATPSWHVRKLVRKAEARPEVEVARPELEVAAFE